MVQMRRENTRVMGKAPGESYGKANSRPSIANMTPEEKAKRQAETEASYQVWRAEREARKAKRYQAMRSRNMGL